MTELSELKATLASKIVVRDMIADELSRIRPDDHDTWKEYVTRKQKAKATLDNEIQELEFSLSQRLKYEAKLEVKGK